MALDDFLGVKCWAREKAAWQAAAGEEGDLSRWARDVLNREAAYPLTKSQEQEVTDRLTDARRTLLKRPGGRDTVAALADLIQMNVERPDAAPATQLLSAVVAAAFRGTGFAPEEMQRLLQRAAQSQRPRRRRKGS